VPKSGAVDEHEMFRDLADEITKERLRTMAVALYQRVCRCSASPTRHPSDLTGFLSVSATEIAS